MDYFQVIVLVCHPQVGMECLIFIKQNSNLFQILTCIYSLKTGTKSGLKWIEPKQGDLNKYTTNSSIGCVIKIDFEYPKKLPELHNDYPLTPDKVEIKR